MTDIKMTRIVDISLVLLMIVLLGSVIIYHGKYRHAEQRATDAKHKLSLATDTINNMQVRQHDLEALDAKYTKELADAKTANDDLQRKLDHGGRVLVKGRCPTTATAAARTSGMDDAGTIELSTTAGRNVLGIRKGILRDQAALKGLQQYIREQCLK